MQPILRGFRKRRQLRHLKLDFPYNMVFPFTQASLTRQQHLVKLCQELSENKIEGAIIECGVLDGGTSALMAWASAADNRPIHLFDAWEGLPKSAPEDGMDARKWEGQVVGSPKRVNQIFTQLKIDPKRVTIHHGWFNETFPKADINRVALLHIDCDFFEPTELTLSRWWHFLMPGGVIQIDDYSAYQGCRKAVDEFLNEHPELKLETFGPEGSGEAYFIRKPKE
jgi:O-methyltransferase